MHTLMLREDIGLEMKLWALCQRYTTLTTGKQIVVYLKNELLSIIAYPIIHQEKGKLNK